MSRSFDRVSQLLRLECHLVRVLARLPLRSLDGSYAAKGLDLGDQEVRYLVGALAGSHPADDWISWAEIGLAKEPSQRVGYLCTGLLLVLLHKLGDGLVVVECGGRREPNPPEAGDD